MHTPAIEFYKDCFSVLKDKGSVKKKNEFFEESLYHLGIIKWDVVTKKLSFGEVEESQSSFNDLAKDQLAVPKKKGYNTTKNKNSNHCN